MTQGELTHAIFAANDVALQWYAVTHQQAIPGAPGTVVVSTPPGGGLGMTFGSGTMVLAVIAIVAAVLILKK